MEHMTHILFSGAVWHDAPETPEGYFIDLTPEAAEMILATEWPADITPAEKLTSALKRATFRSMRHCKSEDGGTCNFDAPAVDWKAAGFRKKADFIAAVEAANLRCFEWSSLKGLFVISGIGWGQGNRRTRMAEAAYQSLKADGYNATMYYQMD